MVLALSKHVLKDEILPLVEPIKSLVNDENSVLPMTLISIMENDHDDELEFVLMATFPRQPPNDVDVIDDLNYL